MEMILAQTTVPKVPKWPSDGNFLQGHPKPAFCKNVQRGDQGKFFKNRPKRCPRLKGPNALWRKWHYPLISMHLNGKDWKTLWRKKRLQKCPNGQVLAIFARSPKSRIFLKSAKGGPKEIFQKSPKKMPSFKRPKSKLAQMALSSYKYALFRAKTGEDFGAERLSKSARMAELWKISQGHPKPAFFRKSGKGGPRDIFQKSPEK